MPPNPLRGLPSDAAYLSDFLSTIAGPVVLAGHSYGDIVTSNAAAGSSQVKALVYVDAYVPVQGDTLLGLTTAKPGSCLAMADPTTVFNEVTYPASEAAILAAGQRPLAASVLSEPSGAPAWKTIPSWDVIGTADHVIPPAEQLFMAKRAGARITEVNAPHLSMISDPGLVTRVIVQAVQSAG